MKACADFTRPLDIPTFANFSALISDELWREGRISLSGDSQESFSFMEKTEVNGYLLDFETLLNQEKQYAEAKTEDPSESPGEHEGEASGENAGSGESPGNILGTDRIPGQHEGETTGAD